MSFSKSRIKRSKIWLGMSDEDFKILVKNSRHIGDVLLAFGLENVGRNHYTAQTRIRDLNINIEHFNSKDRKYSNPIYSIEETFIINSTISQKNLKNKILKNNLLENKCSICGMEPFWFNKKLILILDHINGKRHDNRLENLRLLFPNCNSQTNTFAGRNNKYNPE